MTNKGFRFDFDLGKVEELRSAMNEELNFSMNKIYVFEGHKYNAWGCMCATMDRIEDTLNYINNTPIGVRGLRLAFDFLEFVNNVYSVIESIKSMARIFNVDTTKIKNIENLHTAFNQESTDDVYFKYLRSLCSVHAVNTTFRRGREFMHKDDVHSCPRVFWSKEAMLFNYDADLVVQVYNGNKDCYRLDILLNVESFIKHLNNWLDFIPEIICAIKNYNFAQRRELRNIPVNRLSDFDNNVVDYLKYLKEENHSRFGDSQDEIFDNYLRLFSVTISNPQNIEKIRKYQNAIVYSLQFLHYQLQHMELNSYESTGIKYPDEHSNSDLFYELYSTLYSCSNIFKNSHYQLSKLYYLESSNEDFLYEKRYARCLLDEIKPAINRYVFFDNTETDDETIVLLYTALYLDALENFTLLNQNIPNDIAYRTTILTPEEYKTLIEYKKEQTEISYIFEDLKDLFD